MAVGELHVVVLADAHRAALSAAKWRLPTIQTTRAILISPNMSIRNAVRLRANSTTDAPLSSQRRLRSVFNLLQPFKRGACQSLARCKAQAGKRGGIRIVHLHGDVVSWDNSGVSGRSAVEGVWRRGIRADRLQ